MTELRHSRGPFFQHEAPEVLDIGALNNTRRADREVLFFNRVPKVGSQTFMELLRRLSIRNAFSFNRDRVQRVETIRLAPIEQVRDDALPPPSRPSLRNRDQTRDGGRNCPFNLRS